MADDKVINEALQQLADLQESIGELEQLALEDRGWTKVIGDWENGDRTPEGRKRISDMCEIMTVANPLIKRGFMLRYGYVWGAGVTVNVESGESKDGNSKVNEIVQTLLDDPRNAVSFHSEAAYEQLERWCYTHGNVVLLLDTDPDSGEVVVRQEDPDHVTEFITDPEDTRTVRFWRRTFTVRSTRADGSPGVAKTKHIWHPDIDYDPEAGKDKDTGEELRPDKIGKYPVRWDQPLLVRTVNTPAQSGWSWGVPDAHAAVNWARMSKEFLEAWYMLMRALSRYAWKSSSKTSGARRVADATRTALQAAQNPTGAGAHVFTDPDSTLEAVPKSGATIDAASALPLQQFVAAALGVPLTMLLGDPGTTGARAVAETLDQPTENEMGARRKFWSGIQIRVCQHAIDAAVMAKKVPGATYEKSGGRRTIKLPKGWSRTISVDWPSYDSTPIDVAMKALAEADGLDKLPAEVIVSEALRILGIENPDEWITKMTEAGAFSDMEPGGERQANQP